MAKKVATKLAPFIVTVTDKHIKNGRPGHLLSCPIALALRDAGFTSPSVSSEICFSKNRKSYRTIAPKRAETFMSRFDDGGKVKPFSFRLAPELV